MWTQLQLATRKREKRRKINTIIIHIFRDIIGLVARSACTRVCWFFVCLWTMDLRGLDDNKSRFVCPSDRQLALRAKWVLKQTHRHVKSRGKFHFIYVLMAVCPQPVCALYAYMHICAMFIVWFSIWLYTIQELCVPARIRRMCALYIKRNIPHKWSCDCSSSPSIVFVYKTIIAYIYSYSILPCSVRSLWIFF